MGQNRLSLFDAKEFERQSKEPGWGGNEGSVFASQKKLGVSVIHVAWKDQDGKILYDQILRAEKGGGVFLPVDETGRVGLQKMFRPQTTNQKKWAEDFPNIKVEELGRESYEVPRGFAKALELGHAAAVREAEQETNSMVVDSMPLGMVCDNTALSPHMTSLAIGKLDRSRRPNEEGDIYDELEDILKPIQFFTLEETGRLITEGKLYCAYTLSAIGMVMITHPNLLRNR